MLRVYFFLALPFIAVANAAEPAVSHPEGKASLADAVGKKPIRMILTDVDGTLANATGTFFDPNDKAFPMARLLGIQVAFATGRGLEPTLKLVGDRKLSKMGYHGAPGVYLNGSYVLGSNGEVLRDEPLKPEIVKRMLDIFEEEGRLKDACAVLLNGLFYYGEHKHRATEPVYKMHFEAEPEVVAKMRRRLEAELGNKIEFRQSHDRNFQVVTPGYDKGEGMRLLCEHLNISPDQVLTMGNAFDDLPMFKLAGTSVAVGDAYPAVKDVAKYVTVDHTEGALFHIVREIISHELFPKPGSGTPED